MDEDERTMQALHDAILDALFNGGVLPDETIERLLGDPADGDQDGCAIEARGADPADHRADGRSRATSRCRPISTPSASGVRAAAAGTGAISRAADVRGHRQGARLSRLSRAARSARLARQEQLRPPRHARAGDRRRDDRRAEAVRVRRHAEPRRRQHAAERGPARSARACRADRAAASRTASTDGSTSRTRT